MADPRLALVEKLNASAHGDGARVTFERLHAFGDSTVQRYRLGNGLTVLVLVDRSAPVVSYQTWFNVGSRHEVQGKTGLAHLFEHLMFNETEGFKAGEIDRKLEENGAETNAGTWFDWTYYYESVPADRVGLVVKLESERMGRLVLREPQVKSEKEVVANERRYRVDDDVEGAANELLYKTAFVLHPYHWPTIGWMEDIQGFTPDDCAAFYRTYYAPNNALVVVVGDVREARLLEQIRDAYGPLPSASIPPDDAHPEPPQTEERAAELRKATPTEKLFVGYKGPALGDADHPMLTLLNEVLFGGRASRLYRALIIEREIASDLRGWVSAFRDPGLYEVYATARTGKKVDEALAVIDEQVNLAQCEVVSDDELARAKARVELALLQSMETTGGKAEQIGFYETVLGDPCAAFRRLEAYRRATPADLRRVARRYLVPRSRTLVRVLPEDGAPKETS